MNETAILQEPATIDDILHPTNELTTHDETFVVDTEGKATFASSQNPSSPKPDS